MFNKITNTMKRTKIILAAIACIISINMYAQDAVSRIEIPLNKINTIVLLNLDGNSTLVKSGSDKIDIKSELFVKGDNWGWKFPESRPEFKIVTKQSNDTLYVSTPAEFDYKIIGISTYTEVISSIIQIPAEIKLIIKKADKLTINTNFQELKIFDSKVIDFQNIERHKLESLVCKAGSRLTVNNVERQPSYEFQGGGLSKYFFEADIVTLKIH